MNSSPLLGEILVKIMNYVCCQNIRLDHGQVLTCILSYLPITQWNMPCKALIRAIKNHVQSILVWENSV